MTRRLSACLCSLLLTGASVGTATAQQAAPTTPTLEGIFSVLILGDPQISPDGDRVLYTAQTRDLVKNQLDTDIWLAASAGGDPVRLTRNPKNDTRPRWRPDGRELAFLSVRAPDDPKASIYRMNPAGGEAEKLCAHPTTIESFEWAPDGRSIAFTAKGEDDSGEKERKEKGRDVRVEDGPASYTQIWLLDTGTGKARRLTEGRDRTVQSFAWSPDGRRIVFAATASSRVTDWESDLYLVDVADSTAVPTHLTSRPGSENTPSWSPDGRYVLFNGSPGATLNIGYSRAFRVAVSGGEPEDVSPKMDLEPSPYVLSADGTGAFVRANVGTTIAWFYMPLATRQPVRLTPESGIYPLASFSRDRRRAAFVFQSPTTPQELYVATLPALPEKGALATSTRITSHNQRLAGMAVGRTEILHWRSSDGAPVEGIVVHPPNPRGPGPLIVEIHGGPNEVFNQSFQATNWNAKAQLFAADGYTVLLPNPRGSTGYGDAAQRAADWGGLDFQDLMTGVDTLIARGVAHPDSLGVMGWSYGGFMTAFAITHTPRFKAAVVGAGITEPISMWGSQDIVNYYEAFFGGSPYAQGSWDRYERTSALANVRAAKTPTLIIHGANDERVPPTQAILFYRALRANQVPSELVWLPRSQHTPTEPGLQYETVRRQKEWMDRWIRGVPAATPAATPAAPGPVTSR